MSMVTAGVGEALSPLWRLRLPLKLRTAVADPVPFYRGSVPRLAIAPEMTRRY